MKNVATEGTMFFPHLSYIGLTYKMEYVSSRQLDPRITDHKED